MWNPKTGVSEWWADQLPKVLQEPRLLPCVSMVFTTWLSRSSSKRNKYRPGTWQGFMGQPGCLGDWETWSSHVPRKRGNEFDKQIATPCHRRRASEGFPVQFQSPRGRVLAQAPVGTGFWSPQIEWVGQTDLQMACMVMGLFPQPDWIS